MTDNERAFLRSKYARAAAPPEPRQTTAPLQRNTSQRSLERKTSFSAVATRKQSLTNQRKPSVGSVDGIGLVVSSMKKPPI